MLVPLLLPPGRQPFDKDRITVFDLGTMDIICSHCNALHWAVERLSKSSRTTPKFGTCCFQGKISLPPLEPLPPELHQLYCGEDHQAIQFRTHIRNYNSALAMTSVGQDAGSCLNMVQIPGRGPWVYKIQGACHHITGTLLPAEGRQPSYAQLYIWDPASALDIRMANQANRDLDRMTMQILQDMLYRKHPSVALYKQAVELTANIPPEQDCKILLRFDKGCDRRRYNLPGAGSREIAVIIPGQDDMVTDPRDIILYRKGGGLKHINEMSPMYQALHYVLLFPTGQLGWHPNIELNLPDQAMEEPDNQGEGQDAPLGRKRKYISQIEYFAYRLHIRNNQSNHLFRAGRLFQEYVVDSWASAEQSRLRWLRDNQKTIRADVYRGLADAVAVNPDVDGQHLGQRTILPSSFTGSTRAMIQNLQDALAINRHYGGADLFLTMTADPNWPEIKNALLPGQSAVDRPDLVCRVFKAKMEQFMRDLHKEAALGVMVAYVWTLEFQKRTLPHIHMVTFLGPESKLRTPEDVDSIISAEFPDKDTQPELYALVAKHMVHGPCGADNPTAPCMENGKCTKNFPKPFREFTTISEDSYAVYRRRNDGRKHTIRGVEVDNRWIVPHSPWLLYRYQCHLNVESVFSIKSIKYIYKYVYKGHDCTTMQFGRANDEIQLYLDARYIGSCEGIWRIYQFPTHKEYPAVVRLQIHLPGQQWVTWNQDEHPDMQEIVDQAAEKDTVLTAYFKANETHEAARNLLYQDFPNKFVWVDKKKKWKIRQREFAIGRMYYVHPTSGERFYLRLLLTAVKGAISFEHLRTVNGVLYPTFKTACIALGLLEDDNEWTQCLQEASVMQTGSQLRFLFVTILRDCFPAQPEILWNEFKEYICDDLKHALRHRGIPEPTEEQAYDYGLYLIERILKLSGKSLADYEPMPVSQENWDHQFGNHLILEQRSYDHLEQAQLAEERIPNLNIDQRYAYDQILNAVATQSGQCFFLSGPGGTGKTYLYNTLCHTLRSEGKIVLCVASSGIAALLLNGGRTAHSRFKIPINLHEGSTCSISKTSLDADLVRHTSLIICDEITMLHRYAPEAIDRTLCDILNSDKPFGGITVVFGGDFQQILPVVLKGSRPEIIGACFQRSKIWRELQILYLKINMRLGQDDEEEREFARWQLDVGHGKHTDPAGSIKIPSKFHCQENKIESLINNIYPGITNTPHPPDHYFYERSILSARNDDVDALNKKILDSFPGQEKIYHSADSIKESKEGDASAHMYPVEYLNSINASGLPLAKLALKVGCPVMVLRNLNPQEGVCNGTRGIVTRLGTRIIEIRLLGGDHAGKHVFIPRLKIEPNNTAIPFQLCRFQFPLRLAFVMTINKSQGQSLKHVGLDFRSPIFTHGQFYVGISRATSVNRIKIIWDPKHTHPITTNIVYPEVLLD